MTAESSPLARFDSNAQQWRIAGGVTKVALAKSEGEPVLTAGAQMQSRLFGN